MNLSCRWTQPKSCKETTLSCLIWLSRDSIGKITQESIKSRWAHFRSNRSGKLSSLRLCMHNILRGKILKQIATWVSKPSKCSTISLSRIKGRPVLNDPSTIESSQTWLRNPPKRRLYRQSKRSTSITALKNDKFYSSNNLNGVGNLKVARFKEEGWPSNRVGSFTEPR
jgi:hypothetical protein